MDFCFTYNSTSIYTIISTHVQGIMPHVVEDKRKQKIPEFILKKQRMNLDHLKQKWWDSQVTVKIMFLFFKQKIFLDIEVKISSISNSPEKKLENHLPRGFCWG